MDRQRWEWDGYLSRVLCRPANLDWKGKIFYVVIGCQAWPRFPALFNQHLAQLFCLTLWESHSLKTLWVNLNCLAKLCPIISQINTNIFSQMILNIFIIFDNVISSSRCDCGTWDPNRFLIETWILRNWREIEESKFRVPMQVLSMILTTASLHI